MIIRNNKNTYSKEFVDGVAEILREEGLLDFVDEIVDGFERSKNPIQRRLDAIE